MFGAYLLQSVRVGRNAGNGNGEEFHHVEAEYREENETKLYVVDGFNNESQAWDEASYLVATKSVVASRADRAVA